MDYKYLSHSQTQIHHTTALPFITSSIASLYICSKSLFGIQPNSLSFLLDNRSPVSGAYGIFRPSVFSRYKKY